MKTVVEQKKPEIVKIKAGGDIQKHIAKETAASEPEVEVEMISLAPSFLGMPVWKFVVVKDKK